MVDSAAPRLSQRTLSQLAEGVERPGYDRSAQKTGIVHLGIGAFHRAHQAVYTEAALAAGDDRWGTLGVSLRSAATRDALEPQDGLYTLAVRDGEGARHRVVGSITDCLVAPEDTGRLLDVLVSADVRIVSLTITEKGYCHNPASGELEEDHPDIVHDLAHPESPRSAPGFLAETIRRRRDAGTGMPTLLSCDNLPANGRTLARVVARFAALRDPDLGGFVEEAVRFPCTMVDRIVPATTDADRAAIEKATGLEDQWPIATEPFCQWVIEDDFPAGRPDWALGGATFVADVTAYELMKLRLLNGSHSTLAYLGYLAGHETVAETMAAPGFDALASGVMKEAAAVLPPLTGVDVSSYCVDLRHRFSNPALRHRTWQIAMDGSQKLPQRLLGSIRDRLAAGAPIANLATGVAGWMRYCLGHDEANRPIEVSDPLAKRIADATRGKSDAQSIFDAYMRFGAVFGTDLAGNEVFRRAVVSALTDLLEKGAARTVAAIR